VLGFNILLEILYTLAEETGVWNLWFQVLSLLYFGGSSSMHECQHFTEVHGMRGWNKGACPPSAVILAGLVSDLFVYGIVDCAADPNTRGWVDEGIASFSLNRPTICGRFPENLPVFHAVPNLLNKRVYVINFKSSPLPLTPFLWNGICKPNRNTMGCHILLAPSSPHITFPYISYLYCWVQNLMNCVRCYFVVSCLQDCSHRS
jgi:hypothetical protein